MISFIKHISEDVVLGAWEINEDIEQLRKDLNVEERESTKNFHPKKIAEFVASRRLIKAMCEEAQLPFDGIFKDEHGKPHFIDSKHHLSISHSHPMVAGMIHKSQPCGIDIELPREQLRKVSRKFLNAQELIKCHNNLESLCLYWAAKEAIYKVHGRKKLSFSDNIYITDVKNHQLKSDVLIDGKSIPFDLQYEKIERYLLVYGHGTL